MSRYDLTREQLAELVADEPRYRTEQLFDGLYKRLVEPDEVSELPAKLRARLREDSRLERGLTLVQEFVTDGSATRKWLLRLHDEKAIETVLMHYPRHSTVCVSSQAGCAMGCTFCATGQAGYERHLSTGEILEQVVIASRSAAASGRRLDHVVFMGMGEPFANYKNVTAAARRIITDLGIGARHITISTVGLVPQILRFCNEPFQVNLAVSLHGARDDLRDSLVPINRRYPLRELMAACSKYCEVTHRRISFEWALIDGVNDTPEDVAEVAVLARAVGAHVNVIPLNPTIGGLAQNLRGSPPARVRAFRDGLRELGVNVTVRQTRGREIGAACGQLAGATPLALASRGESN